MKKKLSQAIICACICCTSGITQAQNSHPIASPNRLFEEGRSLFLEKNYAAASAVLQTFIDRKPQSLERQEADYLMVSSAYELQDRNRIERLRNYLERYPDTPYSNRLYALLASCYYYNGQYDEALALFNSTRLEELANDERDERTYQRATAYLKVGQIKEAAIWFETLKISSAAYQNECTYYLSYIRYTQKRYDEALKGFLSLQTEQKHRALVPYYMAEIYAIKGAYDKAEIVAQNYLSAYPENEHVPEMHRILGEVYYQMGRPQKAIAAFESYLSQSKEKPRRDALYLLGLSYYQTNVFSKAASTLEQVVLTEDALTQNAYLNLGLSYLQLSEKNKARMAFEQAARTNGDLKIKEQAAYNYALCLHETAFSAFGESVTAFENFLNEFPSSPYADKVGGYLVEVYMNTRSYEAALTSINRIGHPGNQILESKQKILFQLGTQAFANASFDKALALFNQSIALGKYNPQTKADAYYWCGEIYYRQNKMPQADHDFNTYLQLSTTRRGETYALAHYNLGYIAFHRKAYEKAQAYFEQFIRLEADRGSEAVADAYNRIGDCFFNKRLFSEAKSYYVQAEQLNSRSGDYAFYQMALVSGLQKDYPGKITLLNRLMGKYPSSAYALNALYEKGRAYVLLENTHQAIASFKELVDKYPKSPMARKAAAEIGLLYYQQESYEEAIKAYKQVVENYPGSEESRLAMRDLKSIYIDMNRIDEFATLAASMPGEIQFDANEQDSLTYVAAEKIYGRGRIEEAKGSFNRYLQAFPKGAFELQAHYYLCVIAYEQKNYDLVLSHSEKLLAYPNSRFSEEALLMRSEILFNLKRYAEALTSYKMLKERASTPSHRLLAKTNLLRTAYLAKQEGEVIQAATDLLEEPKLSPELKNEALYDRAKAYLAQKAGQKAMTDLQQLAKDTRNLYGAEAKYLVAQQLFDSKEYRSAEKELLDYIDQSTPHAYWLARGFVLLSDVYSAMGKTVDARQYLLSLQQNYSANDDIQRMIDSRLTKLKNK
ncbi:MAG: tetratricopeptide repeat protein [Bacteroidia bacterium]|nr:tetratricopeptide repeat protein [Bacteroidia bacterium]